MTAQKAEAAAEKRLKTIEAALKKLVVKYEQLDEDCAEHIMTPDAHNPGMLGRK